MAARVINADGVTIVGTVEQIAALFGAIGSTPGASVVRLTRANLVVIKEPLSRKDLAAAIEASPKKVIT